MTDIDNVRTIVDTATRTVAPAELTPGKVYAFNTPGGVHQVDLTGDDYRDAPSRKRGTTTVRDAQSFISYWAKHSDADSEVYADADRLTITAVLDANTVHGARWAGHRLHLGLRQTDAWKQWATYDGKLIGQDAFAEFIEDHLPELLEPSAADMLEIAQSIQGATKAEFQSATRLSSGQRQFSYVETTTAKAGQKGNLVIPETFTIGLVPFEGSEGYKLTARFRYRLGRDGELTLGYKLDRPGDIIRTAFQDVVTAVAEQVDSPILNGTPA